MPPLITTLFVTISPQKRNKTSYQHRSNKELTHQHYKGASNKGGGEPSKNGPGTGHKKTRGDGEDLYPEYTTTTSDRILRAQ